MLKKLMSVFLVICLAFLNFPALMALNFYDESLNSQAVYMVDYDTGVPIVEKNIDEIREPASLTKIVTFLVVYENSSNRDDTKVTVSKEVLDMVDSESSGSKLKEGEEFSITDLLHCMMISSSGYAAMVLAHHIGGGDVEKFVGMMNDKVDKIGCENTHFENPDGIHSENQYTTAHDMYKITNYAMNNSDFLNIVSKSHYNMFGDGRDPVTTTNHLINKSRNDEYYLPYVKGIKTGYTENAGRCLISYAEKDGKTYVLVVMGGPTKDSNGKNLEDNMAMIDSIKLYEWAFNDLVSVNLCEKYYPLTQTDLEFVWGKDSIILSADKDLNIVVPQNVSKDEVSFEFDVPKTVKAPVKKGDVIGKANVIYSGQKIGYVDLVSTQNFDRNYFLVVFSFLKLIVTSKIFIFLFVFLMLLLAFYICFILSRNMKQRKKNKIVKISKFRKDK